MTEMLADLLSYIYVCTYIIVYVYVDRYEFLTLNCSSKDEQIGICINLSFDLIWFDFLQITINIKFRVT